MNTPYTACCGQQPKTPKKWMVTFAQKRAELQEQEKDRSRICAEDGPQPIGLPAPAAERGGNSGRLKGWEGDEID